MNTKEIIKTRYMINDHYGLIDELEIPRLAFELGVSETTIKKGLKALNCQIYKRHTKKTKNVEQYREEVSQLKLTIKRRVPKWVQRKSVRELIGRPLWGKVRTPEDSSLFL